MFPSFLSSLKELFGGSKNESVSIGRYRLTLFQISMKRKIKATKGGTQLKPSREAEPKGVPVCSPPCSGSAPWIGGGGASHRESVPASFLSGGVYQLQTDRKLAAPQLQPPIMHLAHVHAHQNFSVWGCEMLTSRNEPKLAVKADKLVPLLLPPADAPSWLPSAVASPLTFAQKLPGRAGMENKDGGVRALHAAAPEARG